MLAAVLQNAGYKTGLVIFPTSLKDFYYNPKDSLNNLDICITGEVKMYNGKAEIIVSKPNQITANKK